MVLSDLRFRNYEREIFSNQLFPFDIFQVNTDVKIEATRTYEIFLYIYQTTRCHNPEEGIFTSPIL
jgi:hypothetical protein